MKNQEKTCPALGCKRKLKNKSGHKAHVRACPKVRFQKRLLIGLASIILVIFVVTTTMLLVGGEGEEVASSNEETPAKVADTKTDAKADAKVEESLDPSEVATDEEESSTEEVSETETTEVATASEEVAEEDIKASFVGFNEVVIKKSPFAKDGPPEPLYWKHFPHKDHGMIAIPVISDGNGGSGYYIDPRRDEGNPPEFLTIPSGPIYKNGSWKLVKVRDDDGALPGFPTFYRDDNGDTVAQKRMWAFIPG